MPLPVTEDNHVSPQRIFFPLLNRNYVKKELRDALFEIGKQLNKKYPGSKVYYLDANFPFINKFPLLPHLSHSDGNKVDISFCYRNSNDNSISDGAPSPIGYGVSEEPTGNKISACRSCEAKGHWQYGLISKIVPQYRKRNFIFDDERTRTLIQLFVNHLSIKKIFIEPHLKQRLKLNSSKIKFHGCRAARHDDHIHVQIN